MKGRRDLMNEEKREREKIQKQKKIIIIVMVSLVLFAIAYYLITLIDFDSMFDTSKNEDVENKNIYFYDESLSKYPSEDEWYMQEMYKEIEFYYGTGTVFSESILTDEDAIERGDAFYLLFNLIGYIKAGNHEGYNSCFSSYYFNSHSYQSKFTRQKLYDIKITELPEETKSSGGVTYIEYNYTIEYKIRHNNGSLRKDIGSDQSKKQYVKLSNRTGAGILIDNIFTIKETVIQ